MTPRLRIIDTKGSKAVVRHVTPVAPVIVTRVTSHPGEGGRWRASVVWVVEDAAGQQLGAYYQKRDADAMAADARAAAAPQG
jgi:hypothetical protein